MGLAVAEVHNIGCVGVRVHLVAHLTSCTAGGHGKTSAAEAHFEITDLSVTL